MSDSRVLVELAVLLGGGVLMLGAGHSGYAVVVFWTLVLGGVAMADQLTEADA